MQYIKTPMKIKTRVLSKQELKKINFSENK